jgi:hypothetical protein
LGPVNVTFPGTKKLTSAERTLAAGLRLAEWLRSRYSKRHPAKRLLVFAQTMATVPLTEEDIEDFGEINEICDLYPFKFQMIVGVPRRHRFELGIAPMKARGADGCGAINDIRILAEADALSRIRWCVFPQCKKAFFLRRGSQRFCSARCEQQWRSWDPDRKTYKSKHYLEHGTKNKKKLLEKRLARIKKLEKGNDEQRLEALLERRRWRR